MREQRADPGPAKRLLCPLFNRSREESTNSTACFCSGRRRSEAINPVLPPRRSKRPDTAIDSRHHAALPVEAAPRSDFMTGAEDLAGGLLELEHAFDFFESDPAAAVPQGFGEQLRDRGLTRKHASNDGGNIATERDHGAARSYCGRMGASATNESSHVFHTG